MISYESFERYADLIRRHYQKLPEKQVVSLITSYQNFLVEGKTKEARDAQEQIVKAFWPLVVKFTNKITYLSAATSKEDLVQDGLMGLLRAMKTFDPELGYKFSTYAGYWIMQVIGRQQQKMEKHLKLPETIYGKYRKFIKRNAELTAERGYGFTEEEKQQFCQEFRLDYATFEELLLQPISLSNLTHDDKEETLESRVPSKDEAIDVLMEDEDRRIEFVRAATRLYTRKAKTLIIVFSYLGLFYNPKTVEELAADLGMTPRQVKAYLVRGLSRIKKEMER